jgi:uncharacterized membrane protein YjgN (DUF898 family)
LLWPLLLVPSFYLLGPFAHQQMRKFLHEGVRYGNLPGRMTASVGAFYVVYAFTLLIVVGAWFGVGLVLWSAPGLVASLFAAVPTGKAAIGAGMLFAVVAIALVSMLVFILVAGPYFIVRIRNLVWNHSAIGAHEFRSRAHVWPYIWITISNFVLIFLTLGLFLPFAQIRKARYLVQTMALVPQGSLDEVVATQQDHVNAVGQETADLFDLDIAL